MVGHARQQRSQRGKKRLPVVGGVEPHLRRRKGRHEVRECEMQIARVGVARGIGELVLVEIRHRGAQSHLRGAQSQQLRQG